MIVILYLVYLLVQLRKIAKVSFTNFKKRVSKLLYGRNYQNFSRPVDILGFITVNGKTKQTYNRLLKVVPSLLLFK